MEKAIEKVAKKKKFDFENIVELIVVIMLGITALLTAWASWIGSLHGGNQATNYATSNNLAAEGNSEYNAAVQKMNQDMQLWSDISFMQMEIIFAQSIENEDDIIKNATQLFYKLDENIDERMAAQIGWEFELTEAQYNDLPATILEWMKRPESVSSPFFDQEYINTYFVTTNELLAESASVLEQGQKDNKNSDEYGLVTVIYSVVLFLLGIAGSFKNIKNKYAVIIISTVFFIAATIYMFTLPFPTGFSIVSFFSK